MLAMPALADPVSGQGTWEDTLKARDIDGNGTTDAFYDTTLNITWLANANANGAMNWSDANTWANNLVVGSNTNWRLPTIVDTGSLGCNFALSGTDCGWNVQTKIGSTVYSEMAHLFGVTLGNKGYYNTSGISQAGWGLTNTGNFSNMQSNFYWSGLQEALYTNSAMGFNTVDGGQLFNSKSNPYIAMAVHSGDVAITAAIPEPETYALMLAGLGLVGGIARRRKAKQTA